MLLKAIIVEDEEKSADNLKILIEEFCPDVTVTGIAKSVSTAASLATSAKPDIIFLDINLNGESGFDFFNRIEPRDFAVIFTTAYSNYALQAFRVAALDYLLKPISIQHLQEAVNKARKSKSSDLNGKLEKLLTHISHDDPSGKIALHTTNGVYFIKTREILFCESDSNYTNIHLANGEKHTVSKTLKCVETSLPANLFFRIHHSYLVNLDYVKKYDKNDSTVLLDSGKVLAVSKRRQNEFVEKLGIK